MRHHLAIAACLALTASLASAKPARRHHHHKKHRTPPAEEAVAVEEPAAEVDVVVAPGRRAGDWHVAVGPYLWASSVDANLSVGSANIASGVDFLQTVQHAKYGAELLADARYHKVSLSGDLMYGVVGLAGGNSVGPVMVTVTGEASSLLVDGFAGYEIAGDEHSPVAFEVRGGIRYQRTAVLAAVDVGGTPVAQPAVVDAGRDALAGARVFVRPTDRVFLTGTGDIGVAGTSSTTWSAAADASVRIGSHVVLSLGYRTLTLDRPHMSMVMHGPRAALQLVF
jgi:hypothetical protein